MHKIAPNNSSKSGPDGVLEIALEGGPAERR